jgi:hypothetical protein
LNNAQIRKWLGVNNGIFAEVKGVMTQPENTFDKDQKVKQFFEDG